MRRNRRILVLSTVFALLAVAHARATEFPSKPWPFTAAFMGTGRLCYGGLYLREKTISWLIPYSQCQRVPFDVMEQWGEGNERNIVFRLKYKPANCRFGVIYLTHKDNPNFGIRWEAAGYADEAEFRRARENNWLHESLYALSCGLYVP